MEGLTETNGKLPLEALNKYSIHNLSNKKINLDHGLDFSTLFVIASAHAKVTNEP